VSLGEESSAEVKCPSGVRLVRWRHCVNYARG
jgi:hypothetical protein